VVLVAALTTGAVLAFAPVIATESCVASSLGTVNCSSGHVSLLANEGAGVLVVLALPALVAVLPVIVPSRRRFSVFGDNLDQSISCEYPYGLIPQIEI